MIDYVRDPEEIYRLSFAAIRKEADLSGLPEGVRPLATRLMHASGMTDLAKDLRFDERIAGAVRRALDQECTILVDSEMVKAGIIARFLPAGVKIICTLNHPDTQTLAAQEGTTRSAAAVSLWAPYLANAVVVIGNAPTALFGLLETLGRDAAVRPAAIIAIPVGFVGAVESKAALAENPRGIPFVTVLGRRGGSAMAAAAFNALTAKQDE